MLGLERGTVRIVPYDPGWDAAFEHEKARLVRRIGALVLDIQHVGSTAVPGLVAKPILDIAVAVDSMDRVASLRPELVVLGYIDRGDSGDDGGHLFVKDVAPAVRSHHLHIVASADPQWCNYLAFRDRLRSDEDLRAEYARLKCSLARQFVGDRVAYTQGKHSFIRGVLQARP